MLRKTAIITGSSGGIGSETALLFARNGYNIVLAKHKSSTKELEEKIIAFGVEVKSFPLELESYKSIEKFFANAFKAFEYVDVVVCCAGIAEKFGLFFEKDVKDIDRLININLRGTMLCNKESLKYLTAQKHGNIINISSIYGESGGSYESSYSATKGGIIALTKALSLEVAPFKVRVNAVAPGFIDTKMTSSIQGSDREDAINQIPLKRLGKPLDVANLILFLAQDTASYITGECFSVNGGVIRFD